MCLWFCVNSVSCKKVLFFKLILILIYYLPMQIYWWKIIFSHDRILAIVTYNLMHTLWMRLISADLLKLFWKGFIIIILRLCWIIYLIIIVLFLGTIILYFILHFHLNSCTIAALFEGSVWNWIIKWIIWSDFLNNYRHCILNKRVLIALQLIN